MSSRNINSETREHEYRGDSHSPEPTIPVPDPGDYGEGVNPPDELVSSESHKTTEQLRKLTLGQKEFPATAEKQEGEKEDEEMDPVGKNYPDQRASSSEDGEDPQHPPFSSDNELDIPLDPETK